jgi:prepilin-type N-terminal cleavage/methylation domain-containing protein
MCNLTKRTGFSLIEIVIAISLVAIFVTLPSLAFTNYLKQSRDEKRKSDVNKIQSALEAYKAENGVYPEDLDVLVEEGYMSEIPQDPMQGQDVPGTNGTEQFGYEYNLSPDGLSYELSSRLEGKTVGGPGGSGGGETPEGGANDAGDIYIVTPKGPKTISHTDLLSATPTAPLPTRTTTPTPTTIISITTTPTPTPPPCDQTISCTGTCQTLPNRCGSYASTQSGCTYTTRSGGGSCSPAPAPNQACTASSSCSPGWTCSGTNCLSPTPTPVPCNSGITCSGSCQTLPNRCGSYASTQTGCTYTTLSGGGTCAVTAAPNQSCTASSSCTPGWTCSGTNCLSPTPTPTATPTPRALVRLGNTMDQVQMVNDVSKTLTNGMLIAGVEDSCCDTKAVLSMLNSAGSQTWARIFRLQYNSYLSSVTLNSSIQATDGSIYTVGYANISSSGLDRNAVVVKFNSSGTMQWATGYLNSYGSSANEIIQTSDGNFVVVGYLSYPGASCCVRNDAMIMKINSSGTQIWKRQYGTATESDSEGYTGVAETADGGLIATGYNNNTGIITKFDSSGIIQWTRTLSSVPYGIVQMADGTYTITASSAQTDGQYLARLNSDGSVAWARWYKPASTFDQYDPPTEPALSENGDITFALGSQFGAIGIRTNSSGTVLWGRRFGPTGGSGCLDDPYCSYLYTYNNSPKGAESINGGSTFVSTYMKEENYQYSSQYYLASYTSAGSIPGTCSLNAAETINSNTKTITSTASSLVSRTPGTSTASFSYVNIAYTLSWTNSCN